MIQPIKQNIAFRAKGTPSVYDAVAKNSSAPAAPKPAAEAANNKPKKGVKEAFRSAKLGIMNFIKGFNNVKDTTGGVIKGAAEGVIGATVIGTIGANIIKSKNIVSDSLKQTAKTADEVVKDLPLGKIVFKTITGIISDVAKAAWGVIKSIPNAFTKAPKDNLKNLVEIPGKFIKYTGSKKLVALCASVIAVMTAIGAIKGKIKANRANANVDHSLNEGHIPTK